ncbi:MAG: ABC transporter permease [Acidimicrobiia bacterium]
MTSALVIAGKDLRQRLRDRSAYIFGLAAPLGLATIFSLLLGNIDEGAIDFAYTVHDGDGGVIGRAFVDEVLAGVAADGTVEISEVASQGEAVDLAESGEVDASFLIPSGFSDAALQGAPLALRVVGFVDAPVGTQVATSIAESFSAELQRISVSVATAQSLGATVEADLQRAAATQAAAVAVETSTAASRQLDLSTYYSAAMAILFVFFTVQVGVAGMLDEKKQGTMARLLSAPIPRASVVAGKGLAAYVLGVGSVAILVLATTLLLGASWGDPFGVTLLVLSAVVAAVGIMAVVATQARTAEQAGVAQAIVALVMAILGGVFFPTTQGFTFLANLAFITPHAWFLRGLGDLAGGGGASSVMPAVAALLAFAVASLAVARLGLRRMLAP